MNCDSYVLRFENDYVFDVYTIFDSGTVLLSQQDSFFNRDQIVNTSERQLWLWIVRYT